MKAKTIHKNELVGKYVEYQDRDGKYRINKVVKVVGNKLTVKDAVKRRRCVHLDDVLHQIHHGHCKVEIIRGREKQ